MTGSAPEVYGATADRYVEFAGTTLSVATEDPWELDLLGAFCDALAPDASVVDLGCGPGRAAAWIADRAGDDGPLAVRGIEPSATFVDLARRLHPGLRFDVGSLQTIPADDASVDAVVCWYSIIHDPLDDLEPAWTELARVLRPGGRLLLAFQSGRGEIRHRENVFDSGGDLDFHRHDSDAIGGRLEAAGFVVDPPATRAASPSRPHESTPQTILTATRR